MDELIKEYKDKLVVNEELREQLAVRRKTYELGSRKIKDFFNEKIEAFRRNEDEELNKENKLFLNDENEVKKITTKNMETINRVRRIIQLKDVFMINDTTEYRIYTWIDGEKRNIEPFKIICDDEYKKVGLYIVKNGKPVNCYSLMVRGRSIFSYEIFRELYMFKSWNVNRLNDEGVNIKWTIREGKSVEELIGWYEKPKNKISKLQTFIDTHKLIEREYEEMLEKYNNKEWNLFYYECKMRETEDNYNNIKERYERDEEYQKMKSKLEEMIKNGRM